MSSPEEERAWWDAHATREDTFDVAHWQPGTIECLKAIEPILPDAGWVLDLGVGMGRLAVPILRRFPSLRVFGLDISQNMLDLNSTPDGRGHRTHHPGLRLVRGNGRQIPRDDDFFAAAYSVSLFQHLDPDAVAGYLSEVYRTLQPGAAFRVQVVEGETDGSFLDYRYSEPDLRALAATVGFEVEAVDRGLVFDEWLWVTLRCPAPAELPPRWGT